MTDNVPDRPTQPPLTEEEKQYYRMPATQEEKDLWAWLDSAAVRRNIERSGTG